MKKRPFPDEDEQDEATEAELDEQDVDTEVAEDEAPPEDAEADPEAPMDDEPREPKGMGGPAPKGSEKGPDQFARNGMRLMYSEQMLPHIIKALDGDGSPVEGLLMTLGMVVSRLMESAEKAGKPVPRDSVAAGARTLIGELAELSAHSGGHEYSPKEQDGVLRVFMEAAGATPVESPPEGPGAPPDEAAPMGPPKPRGFGAAKQAA